MKNIRTGYFMLLGIFMCLIYSCEIQENFEYQDSGSTAKLGVTAWEFIQENDSLVMLEAAITRVGLESIYAATDSKTFIAPTNNAFNQFYF